MRGEGREALPMYCRGEKRVVYPAQRKFSQSVNKPLTIRKRGGWRLGLARATRVIVLNSMHCSFFLGVVGDLRWLGGGGVVA